MNVDAFQWTKAGTQTLSVTSSSQQIVVKAGASIEVTNPALVAGTATANNEVLYLEHSTADNNPTANTTTSYPVYPGQCKIFRMPDGATTLAYIGTNSFTATISAGVGI